MFLSETYLRKINLQASEEFKISESDFNRQPDIADSYFFEKKGRLGFLGDVRFLMSKKYSQKLVEKSFTLDKKKDFEEIVRSIKFYKSIQTENFLTIIDFKTREKTSYCSTFYTIDIYFEGYEETVEDEIDSMQRQKTLHKSHNLRQMWTNLKDGLLHLKRVGISYGCVSPENIVRTSGPKNGSLSSYKFIPRVGLNETIFETNKNSILSDSDLYISPEIYSRLLMIFKEEMDEVIDEHSVDCYCLGLVVLISGILESTSDIYSQKEVQAEVLRSMVSRFKGYFDSDAPDICYFIERVLEINPAKRPQIENLNYDEQKIVPGVEFGRSGSSVKFYSARDLPKTLQKPNSDQNPSQISKIIQKYPQNNPPTQIYPLPPSTRNQLILKPPIIDYRPQETDQIENRNLIQTSTRPHSTEKDVIQPLNSVFQKHNSIASIGRKQSTDPLPSTLRAPSFDSTVKANYGSEKTHSEFQSRDPSPIPAHFGRAYKPIVPFFTRAENHRIHEDVAHKNKVVFFDSTNHIRSQSSVSNKHNPSFQRVFDQIVPSAYPNEPYNQHTTTNYTYDSKYGRIPHLTSFKDTNNATSYNHFNTQKADDLRPSNQTVPQAYSSLRTFTVYQPLTGNYTPNVTQTVPTHHQRCHTIDTPYSIRPTYSTYITKMNTVSDSRTTANNPPEPIIIRSNAQSINNHQTNMFFNNYIQDGNSIKGERGEEMKDSFLNKVRYGNNDPASNNTHNVSMNVQYRRPSDIGFKQQQTSIQYNTRLTDPTEEYYGHNKNISTSIKSRNNTQLNFQYNNKGISSNLNPRTSVIVRGFIDKFNKDVEIIRSRSSSQTKQRGISKEEVDALMTLGSNTIKNAEKTQDARIEIRTPYYTTHSKVVNEASNTIQPSVNSDTRLLAPLKSFLSKPPDTSPVVLREIDTEGAFRGGITSSIPLIERSNNTNSSYTNKKSKSPTDTRPFEIPGIAAQNRSTSSEQVLVETLHHMIPKNNREEIGESKKTYTPGISRLHSDKSDVSFIQTTNISTIHAVTPQDTSVQVQNKPDPSIQSKTTVPNISNVTSGSMLRSQIRAPRQAIHPNRSHLMSKQKEQNTSNSRLIRAAHIPQDTIVRNQTSRRRDSKETNVMSKTINLDSFKRDAQRKQRDSSKRSSLASDKNPPSVERLQLYPVPTLNIPLAQVKLALNPLQKYKIDSDRSRRDSTNKDRQSNKDLVPKIVVGDVKVKTERYGAKDYSKNLRIFLQNFDSSKCQRDQRDTVNEKKRKIGLKSSIQENQPANIKNETKNEPSVNMDDIQTNRERNRRITERSKDNLKREDSNGSGANNFTTKHSETTNTDQGMKISDFVNFSSEHRHKEIDSIEEKAENTHEESIDFKEKPKISSSSSNSDDYQNYKKQPTQKLQKTSEGIKISTTSEIKISDLAETPTPKFINKKDSLLTLESNDNQKVTHSDRLKLFTRKSSLKQSPLNLNKPLHKSILVEDQDPRREYQTPPPTISHHKKVTPLSNSKLYTSIYEERESTPISKRLVSAPEGYDSHEKMVISTRSIPLESNRSAISKQSASKYSKSKEKYTRTDTYDEIEFLYAEYFKS